MVNPVARCEPVPKCQPANVDETGWREGCKQGWLWVKVTACVTMFLIRFSRGRKVPPELIPGATDVLTTDRYPVYDHLASENRQACRCHPRPGFQAMIDRDRGGRAAREELLIHADILLKHWSGFGTGRAHEAGSVAIIWGGFGLRSEPCSPAGPGCKCAPTAGVCRELFATNRRGTRSPRLKASSPPTTRPNGHCATLCVGTRLATKRTRRPGAGSSNVC